MKNFSLEKSLSRKTVSRIYVSGCIHTHHGVGCGTVGPMCVRKSRKSEGQHAGAIPEFHAHVHAHVVAHICH